ncbi:S8 family serine peptidase [Solirubrobacter phytolaccae]|uniref:S8 family serine peptidase n=1 Tax=Solirubrobacter phytolaccae TaxID=1404360 RepID=A0A9X3NDI4_9ACTN|nr:S8 family serine peptidase [Solirubrobacter phytolaccae]MDA0184438.1 S8 family serine peptidase [Solirubrobacter phytolaccae]
MRTLFALMIAVLLVFPAGAHAWIPDDKGIGGLGWQADQWNFLPGTGVDAPRAWDNLFAAGRPGGKGVEIAVLDSGVAYENRGRFKKSPDLKKLRFADGYDFCARTSNGLNACEGEDKYPNDDYGHGTHVISTIAESTNNGVALTGLAYGATIIPVKVLNSRGEGDEDTIAAGIRYAVKAGAQVINLSFEFGSSTTSAAQVPRIAAAVRAARAKNVTVVAASGNGELQRVGYPAALPGVISVGAVTEHGCAAVYSNVGPGLDLVAPGGGKDAALPDQPQCVPAGPHGRPIYQLTLTSKLRQTFGYPTDYFGTSMATPHVSATVALIIASGVLGPNPTPDQIEARLKATARDLGVPGPDETYGAGMVDAGAATAR